MGNRVDPKLLEMADVFHIPRAARLKYIIIPARFPGLFKIMNKKKAGKRRGTDHDDRT